MVSTLQGPYENRQSQFLWKWTWKDFALDDSTLVCLFDVTTLVRSPNWIKVGQQIMFKKRNLLITF